MSNGLILSQEDVKMLQSMGFNPKGNFIKADPKMVTPIGGYFKGGQVRGYLEGGVVKPVMGLGDDTGTIVGYAVYDASGKKVGKIYSSQAGAEAYLASLNAADTSTGTTGTTSTGTTGTTSTGTTGTTSTGTTGTTNTTPSAVVKPVYGRDREIIAYQVFDASGKAISKQFGGEAAAQQWLNSQQTSTNTDTTVADGTGTDTTSTGTTGTSIPSWVTPPPEGSMNTQATVTLTNPITGETWTAPTGGYTVNVGTGTTGTGTNESSTFDPNQYLTGTSRQDLLGEEGIKYYNYTQQQLLEGAAADQAAADAAGTAPTTSLDEGVTVPAPSGTAQVEAPLQATAEQATISEKPQLAKAEAVLSSDSVKSYLETVKAAQGEIGYNNLVEAVTQDPKLLAQLQLAAAQIEAAQQVKAPDRLTVGEGELVEGSTVDQARVEDLVTSIKAAEAEPSELATVQGQLAKLTADFDVKNPPAWAAGALRAATATMAARGLGASSMAGQAVIQATFEAATPIAAADAATMAQFEQMNLSNRQAVVMLAAQQRATFLGQEFDQSFQAKVQNASRIAEVANLNFNADVQIALENARLAQSVDIANLDARNAKVLADAAAMTNLELANLNNRQQAAVANAKAFLDMDLANLNNEQQTNVIKMQSLVQSMLSDQAAQNAAINLNTTNENQLNQFYAQLEASVAQFNVAQKNAIAQSNVSEANAILKFNAEQANNMKIAYDRNATTISSARISANASVKTAEISAAATTAAAATRAAADKAIAAAANETKLTLTEMEQQFQRESDIMSMAYDTMTSNADKAFELVKLDMAGEINLEAAKYTADLKDDAATKKSVTDIAVAIVGGLF